MVGDAKDKLIVESLTDGKRSPAFSSEKISTLQEISIYSETDDVPLGDILKNIYEHLDGKPVPDPKKASSGELKDLFGEILPDYDRDAVYVSDMKKVFSWYNILLEKNMLEFPEEDEENVEGDESNADEPDDEKDQ